LRFAYFCQQISIRASYAPMWSCHFWKWAGNGFWCSTRAMTAALTSLT
jgi:hypothetical protein